MTYSQSDIKHRADAIARLCLEIKDEAAAADALGGYLLTQQAHQHPMMFFFAAEIFSAEKRSLCAVTAWRLFIAFLEDSAQVCKEDTALLAESAAALQGFLDLFRPGAETYDLYIAYDIFSEKVNAALDYFDEVTIGAGAGATARSDSLLLGDRALDSGEYELAAHFYRQAAEKEDKPQGWVRLLQMFSQDAAPDAAAAAEACDKAVAAGLWEAHAYRFVCLLPSKKGAAPESIEDALRHARDFISGLAAYAAPLGQATGFSKYLAPVVRPGSVLGIFSGQKPEDIIARLEASARAGDVKSAVSAFMPALVFMMQKGWIKTADIEGLPAALDLFEAVLHEENTMVEQTRAQASPVAGGSFEAEQLLFHDMATRINAQILGSIAEMRGFLSETV